MSKTESAKPGTPWSFRIATVAGIPIRIHLTFLLLLAWVGTLAYRQESRAYALLIPSIFFCVVLHELGHALVAKGFGVKTRDITLYPIGGVAMLEGRPKPFQELWIALAGPFVNVLIAVAVFGIHWALYGAPPSFLKGMQGGTYTEMLFAANVALPIFNMIPAFPMDGGRVLRALLALTMPEVRATQIAGAIGQFLAMLLGFAGLFTGNIVWVLIAFIVFMGAGQEVQTTMGLALLEGRRVEEAMMTRYRSIEHGSSLAQAAKMLLEGSQSCFPVTSNGEVIGLISREGIIRGLSEQGPQGYVAGYMVREFPHYQVGQSLTEVFEQQAAESRLPALVYRDGQVAGILSADNLGEFLMVNQALRKG